MNNLRTVTFWPLCTIALLFTLLVGCKKDTLTPQNYSVTPLNLSLTLEEVKSKYSTGSNDRSGERLPLYVTPLWDESYVVTNNGGPILMTPVDAPCSCPGTRYGGNLAFYKDISGEIKSVFLIWETDSSSSYNSNRAPLDSSSHFTGMMALVNQQDTIEKITQVLNGKIILAKKGKLAFADAPMDFDQGRPIAHGRDPWDFFNWLFNRVKCPNFNNNGIDWSWWNEFWGWVGGVFAGQTWDGAAGEYVSLPPGSFFFGGIEVGWELPDGYIQPGGGSIFGQQYSNQISTCTAINEYIQSIGEIPPGYNQIDLDFCQLVNEVGLTGAEGMCLFSQYGTPQINDISNYWNASSKDLATAEKVKAYIMGQCNGSFAPLLTNLLKENFCLEQHPIDLMENIKNQCGFSSYESAEWYDAFHNGLSDCTKSVIIDDWFDLTNAEKDNLLSNSALFDQMVNFVKSNGCSKAVKSFGSSIIPQIFEHNLVFLTLNDIEFLFDHQNFHAQYLQYLTQNPNATEEQKVTVLRMVFLGPDHPIANLPERLNCFETEDNGNFAHSVAIYVDQPEAGTPAQHSSAEKAGHTWLELYQLNTNGELKRIFIGLYPEGMAIPVINNEDPGAFSEDENRVYDVSVSWGISPAQFNQLINHLKSYSTPPTYNLNSFNCTTFAVNELTNIGVQVPQNSSSWPYGGGLNPGRLGQDLRNMSLPAGADRNTSGGQSPSSSCQ